MNAKEVELAVVNYFGARQNLIVPNVSFGFGLHYEADLIVVSKTGYAKEIEIKVSRADLIKDKQKKHNHNGYKIKELYFAIPEKLTKDIEHIPERAGIFICKKIEYGNPERAGIKMFYKAELLRPAVKNDCGPLTLKDRYTLARLGTLRIWNLKRKILKMRNDNAS